MASCLFDVWLAEISTGFIKFELAQILRLGEGWRGWARISATVVAEKTGSCINSRELNVEGGKNDN